MVTHESDNEQGKRRKKDKNEFFMSEEEEEDLYMLLNVSQECTLEDIQRSYKRLSRTFHPDKLVRNNIIITLDKKETAANEDERRKKQQEYGQEIFLRFKQAYDILSDPVLRQAYDLYGNEGISFVVFHMKKNNDPNDQTNDEDDATEARQDDEDNTGNKDGLYEELRKWHSLDRPDVSSFVLHEAMMQQSLHMNKNNTHRNDKKKWKNHKHSDIELHYQTEMKGTSAMRDRMEMNDTVEIDQVNLGVQFSSNDNASNRHNISAATIGGNIAVNHHTQQTTGQISCGMKVTPVTNTEVSCDLSMADETSMTIQSTRVGTHQTISMAGVTLQPNKVNKNNSQQTLYPHLRNINVGNLFLTSHRNLWDNQFRATWSTAFSPTTFQFHYALLSITSLSPPTRNNKDKDKNKKQKQSNIRYTLKCNIGLDPYPLKLVAFTAPQQQKQDYQPHSNQKRHLFGNWQCSLATNISSFQLNGMLFSQLTPFLSLGMGLSHDATKGLYSIFRLNSSKNSNFSFQIPIHLASPSLSYLLGRNGSRNPNLNDSSLLTSIYYTLFTIGLHQVLDQIQSVIASFHPTGIPTIINQQYTQLQQDHHSPSNSDNDRSYQEAKLQIQNMTPTAIRKMKCEEDKLNQANQGLVILHATYECNAPTLESTTRSQNVTIPLQFWTNTNTSTLHIPSLMPLNVLPGIYGVTNFNDNKNWSLLKSSKKYLNILYTNTHSALSNLWNCFLYGPNYPARAYIPIHSLNQEKYQKSTLCIRYKTLDGVFEVTIRDDQDLILPNPKAMKLGNLQSVF